MCTLRQYSNKFFIMCFSCILSFIVRLYLLDCTFFGIIVFSIQFLWEQRSHLCQGRRTFRGDKLFLKARFRLIFCKSTNWCPSKDLPHDEIFRLSKSSTTPTNERDRGFFCYSRWNVSFQLLLHAHISVEGKWIKTENIQPKFNHSPHVLLVANSMSLSLSHIRSPAHALEKIYYPPRTVVIVYRTVYNFADCSCHL